jgi:hypothetical protein
VLKASAAMTGGVEEAFRELQAVAQRVDGPEWIAILADADDRDEILSRLFEVALFAADIVVVSGIIIDKDGQTVRWSGGVFTSEDITVDLYFGTRFSESGYHGQLYCQRCVDVAAPINILLRKDFVRQTLVKFDITDYLSLLVALGIEAALSGKYIAITPHARHVVSDRGECPQPVDRAGLLDKMSGLGAICRWYNPKLPSSASQAYQIIERRNAHASRFEMGGAGE